MMVRCVARNVVVKMVIAMTHYMATGNVTVHSYRMARNVVYATVSSLAIRRKAFVMLGHMALVSAGFVSIWRCTRLVRSMCHCIWVRNSVLNASKHAIVTQHMANAIHRRMADNVCIAHTQKHLVRIAVHGATVTITSSTAAMVSLALVVSRMIMAGCCRTKDGSFMSLSARHCLCSCSASHSIKPTSNTRSSIMASLCRAVHAGKEITTTTILILTMHNHHRAIISTFRTTMNICNQ
mmetsp:Transcript_60340/g.99572  ORF Transcript_60340/g.99572 Transcript_60340/m.99572 type:complete len:238 (-) Transcript_60340:149-862(-)